MQFFRKPSKDSGDGKIKNTNKADHGVLGNAGIVSTVKKVEDVKDGARKLKLVNSRESIKRKESIKILTREISADSSNATIKATIKASPARQPQYLEINRALQFKPCMASLLGNASSEDISSIRDFVTNPSSSASSMTPTPSYGASSEDLSSIRDSATGSLTPASSIIPLPPLKVPQPAFKHQATGSRSSTSSPTSPFSSAPPSTSASPVSPRVTAPGFAERVAQLPPPSPSKTKSRAKLTLMHSRTGKPTFQIVSPGPDPESKDKRKQKKFRDV